MYIVIVGAGRVGSLLSEELITHGHEVTLIELDQERSKLVADKYDVTIVNGSGVDPSILDEINLSKCDMFIATTGKDEVNILSCLLAKSKCNLPTISRASNVDDIRLFKELGINHVVCPEKEVAQRIMGLVEVPDALDLNVVSEGMAHIFAVDVEANSPFANKKVYDLPKPAEYLIVSIKREKDFIIPVGDTLIKEGDKIYVFAKNEDIKKMEKMLFE